MLFVLFDASLVLHHPGDEIQGHPHFLAMGQSCPSVKYPSYLKLHLCCDATPIILGIYDRSKRKFPTYGTLPYIFLTLR